MELIQKLVKEISLWNPKNISYTKLSGGLSNENYLVCDHKLGKKYVLKMPPAKDSLANRNEEIRAIGKCAEISLSPKLVYVCPEKAFVTEYIEGNSLTPEMLRKSPELLAGCLDVVKQLHERISFQHDNYSFDFARRIAAVLKQQGYTNKNYKAMLDISSEIELRVGSGKQDFCACHNDLITANFIKDKEGKCWLIDFEWSGNNDLYFDLAKFSLFTEISEEKIVQTYFGDAQEDQIGKVFLYKMIQNLLVVQWCASQRQVSTLGLDKELAQLVARHYELFFAAYHNPKYEYYSRKVAAR